MSAPSKINRLIRRQGRRCDWRGRYPPRTQGDRRATVMRKLSHCRHGELGARQHDCDVCGAGHVTLNACRDRHCPACARQARYLWHRDVLGWSLNCDYLHVVTTLPHLINDLVVVNQADLLRLLFRCTRDVLLEMIRDQHGCVPGLILVLHTWGQRLNHHFHIHVVMTAGGLSIEKDASPQRWIEIDPDAMEAAGDEIACRFKKKYLRGVRKALRNRALQLPASLAEDETLASMMAGLERKDWMVNVGATPEKYRQSGQRRMSLGYVGKYVEGTAIGDGRLETIEEDRVTFRAFDYRTGERILLEFTGERFVDAYSDHYLPLRMRRFRMAGIFSPLGREERLNDCRRLRGQASEEHRAQAVDESFNPFAGEEDEAEEEEDGSYVPCPECGKKTSLRLALDGAMTCELLRVVSEVLRMLQHGTQLAIRSAIEIVASAQADRRAVSRALLPGRLETNAELMRFTETVVIDRLREQRKRGPPEGSRG